MKPTLVRLLAVACGALLAAAATAQNFPARTIRIIVPYAPGGSTDVVFRILAPRLAEDLGQQVVVDNRPGGSSTIGLDLAAKSPPDGHTWGANNITYGANPSLIKKMPFDSEKDLLPVSQVTVVNLVVALHPSVPARSIKDLIALAKGRPGQLNFASAGNASANHLATAKFMNRTGTVEGDRREPPAAQRRAAGGADDCRIGRTGFRGDRVERHHGAGGHAAGGHQAVAAGDRKGAGASRGEGAHRQCRRGGRGQLA